MNNRQVLASFDALKNPDVSRFADFCTEPQTDVAGIRDAIRSGDIDTEKFEQAFKAMAEDNAAVETAIEEVNKEADNQTGE
jgi:hypothetical protein